jgi:bacillithiol system protein YtxJ
MNEPDSGETLLADLTDEAGFEALLGTSAGRPQLIFKHSLTCPLSATAYRQLLSYLEVADGSTDHWLVRVQRNGGVSRLVEQRLGVRHESPQAILVRDGRAVWDASHFAITAEALGSVGCVAVK